MLRQALVKASAFSVFFAQNRNARISPIQTDSGALASEIIIRRMSMMGRDSPPVVMYNGYIFGVHMEDKHGKGAISHQQ